MDKEKTIDLLEDSLNSTKDRVRKMRLHYLLAKLNVQKDESSAISHFCQSEDLLIYLRENSLIGFRNFHRYKNKLEDMEGIIEALVVDY